MAENTNADSPKSGTMESTIVVTAKPVPLQKEPGVGLCPLCF